MKRTKTKSFKKADKILTADWHLQKKTPVCRTDDFYEAQWRKLDFISALQKIHDCDVDHAGDLFDYWKPSLELLSKTITHLPKRFRTIYGNHDLPQHNMELARKCGIYLLEKAGHLVTIPAMGNWLTTPEDYKNYSLNKIKDKTYFVWHIMTYQGKLPWPDCTAPLGAKLLIKNPQFDLILTGDNHKPFVEKYEGRLLVNPGSILRRTTDQQNHKPRVYLYYADTNTVEPVFLPIENGVISDDHITKKQERTDRIDAFISKLNTNYEAGLSFEKNLEIHFEKNKTKKEIRNIINSSIE